jgi:hypothetical protein
MVHSGALRDCELGRFQVAAELDQMGDALGRRL